MGRLGGGRVAYLVGWLGDWALVLRIVIITMSHFGGEEEEEEEEEGEEK